jgi:hypothetical protein
MTGYLGDEAVEVALEGGKGRHELRRAKGRAATPRLVEGTAAKPRREEAPHVGLRGPRRAKVGAKIVDRGEEVARRPVHSGPRFGVEVWGGHFSSFGWYSPLA